MLATRQCDTGPHTWSSSKPKGIYHISATPRMSNFKPPSTQPDWGEQYSPFPLARENGLLQPSFEQSTTANVSDDSQGQQQTPAKPLLEHRHSIGPLRQEPQPISLIIRRDSAPGDCGIPANNGTRDDSLVSTESTALSLGSDPLSSVSSAPVQQVTVANNEEGSTNVELKEEEDDDDEDDDEDDDIDLLDIEDGSVPQTAAERRAERRKMKRFRLTHQQTRFLMSEFAKQAHPDAAHRERLSREIPGLSPRQVQVWFQNRRAKIKRLTTDDRERMMKMRAVPDGFDNVQALHSPYGAVHSIEAPMQSPVDFVPNFANHMMQPLMVDTMRRNAIEEHMSPTGLSPAFGHVGFGPQGSMASPDVLSPLSMNSTDRYYSSHLSSPVSAGPRSANPFERQNSYQAQALSHARQHSRPLQPLQLHETMSRSRSESIQSPLRSSMSWKGETLDYGSYQNGQPSPQLRGRQQSVYQPEQIGNSAINAHQYDGNAYANSSTQNSPTHVPYSPSHGGASARLHQSSPATMSRLRASSGAFPPGLDLRNQYRTLPSQGNSHSISTPRSSTFTNPFTGGYASAPLTSPVDFPLPQTPHDPNPGPKDFSVSQSSAPIVPPQNFSSAYKLSLSANQSQQGEQEYGHQDQNGGEAGAQGQGPVEYETGRKRKRGFTMPSAF